MAMSRNSAHPHKVVGSVAQLKPIHTHSKGSKAGSWKALHSRKSDISAIPEVGGMTGTAGGLQWGQELCRRSRRAGGAVLLAQQSQRELGVLREQGGSSAELTPCAWPVWETGCPLRGQS